MASLCKYGHKIPVISSESQNLSVELTLRPTSAVGVLLALVHQDRVPLSIALADYHPGNDEWRDVSAFISICACARVVSFLTLTLPFSVFSTS